MPFAKIKNYMRRFYIKAFTWEYWPMFIVYFPVAFYYAYLSVKAKSFFFFSAANPSIETGGMFFESKWSIFKLMPEDTYPATLYINVNDDTYSIETKMDLAGISFPVIAKPDRGERGWCVKILNDRSELNDYKTKMPVPFLLQSKVNYPLEFSIFYYRHPDSDRGRITSVTFKKLLSITGDGFSTIRELILRYDRAFLQYRLIEKDCEINLNKILNKGEELILVPFGNHVRGAMFLNFQHLIDESLTQVFDNISKQIKGFYFGRYDLRCTSIEDLKRGRNIQILELNGAGAEPAHIYQPGFSFFKAQRVLAAHYKMMYDAAVANHKKGIGYMSYTDYRATKRLEKVYKQSVAMA